MNKKYQIIYADPPWDFKGYDLKPEARYVGNKYSVQSKDWLERLPIGSITDDNCILFLWVTMPKLNECLSLISAWGFEYKTCAFTWIKQNKKTPSLFWGMGRWTRANPEVCLLATKGNPKRISAAVHSVVMSPLEGHSKKPDEVRKRITDLVGELPRIELFARQKAVGWEVWGNEIPNDIEFQLQNENKDLLN